MAFSRMTIGRMILNSKGVVPDMLNVILANIILQNVILLNALKLSVILANAILLNANKYNIFIHFHRQCIQDISTLKKFS
jgi:hypothetical protein